MSCVLLLLVLTGCFQAAGDSLQATSVAQGATFTPSPTLPPIETDTPFPEETAEPFLPEVFVTATPDAFSSVNGQEDFAAQVDEAALTATAIILEATMTSAAEMTATAGVPFATETPIFFPTNTPLVPPTATLQPGGTCTHVVQQGDNLFRIGLRYNVPVASIAAANGIANVNIIRIGDTLTIPGCGGGDFGTGGPITGGGQTYVVQQGDTLFQLSLRFGPTVHEIAAANNIPNINLIYIGQQLVIP
jgi:LysM repeat protein